MSGLTTPEDVLRFGWVIDPEGKTRVEALGNLPKDNDRSAYRRCHRTVRMIQQTRDPSCLFARRSRSAPMNVAQLKEFCRRFPAAKETLYGEPSKFMSIPSVDGSLPISRRVSQKSGGSAHASRLTGLSN